MQAQSPFGMTCATLPARGDISTPHLQNHLQFRIRRPSNHVDIHEGYLEDLPPVFVAQCLARRAHVAHTRRYVEDTQRPLRVVVDAGLARQPSGLGDRDRVDADDTASFTVLTFWMMARLLAVTTPEVIGSECLADVHT